MAPNRPGDRHGQSHGPSNNVHYSPFPDAPGNQPQHDYDAPPPPGGYRTGYYVPPPPDPGHHGPPSINFPSGADYVPVPPAFADGPPLPPPRLEELQAQEASGRHGTRAETSRKRPGTKTVSGHVFFDDLTTPSQVAYQSEEDVLDSVVLSNTTQNFVTLSVGTLPATDQMLQKSGLTLSYTITPLNPGRQHTRAVEQVPTLNFGSDVITRCRICRAYINPFVRTDPQKKFWHCNICGTANELTLKYTPAYNQYTSETNANELELKCGVIEYIASPDYTVRPPQAPAYVFLIDVTKAAVNSRMVEVVCKAISVGAAHAQDLILEDKFPGGHRTMVGVMTYDTAIHFYLITHGVDRFELMVVSDLEDLFLPVPGEVMLNLAESSQVRRGHAQELLKLLEMLPAIWKDTTVQGSALAFGGKVIAFSASPIMCGDFSLKAEEQNPTTSTMNAILQMTRKPTSRLYPIEKAADSAGMMSQNHTTLDLFVCTPQAVNLTNIHSLFGKTSGGRGSRAGNVYYYPHKNHANNTQLVHELKHLVERNTVWESVMRVRVSKGWRITNWHGNCFVRAADLMILPTTNEDHSFTVTFTHDNSIQAPQGTGHKKVMYIQTALLHTTSSGERRIRVFNTAVKVSNDQGRRRARAVKVLESVNVEALAHTMLLGALKVYDKSEKMADARTALMTNCTRVAHSLHAQASTADSLQVLGLYVLGLLKTALFTDEHNQDYRVYLTNKFKSCKLDQVIMYAYPQLYDLTAELSQPEPTLQGLQLSYESLQQENCYLLFNGLYMLLWVGKNVPNNFLQSTFDVPSFEHLNPELVPLAVEQAQTQNAHTLRTVLETLRSRVPPYVPLVVLKQGESDGLFYASLIHDKTQGMMITYHDFLKSLMPGSVPGQR